MITKLPISQFLPEIYQALASQTRLVLQAEPGAGKSTALPLSLLGAPWLNGKKILMLEPRRIAAKSIANYLAQQLAEPVGQRVGYQIKNDRKVSTETQLEIVTEGILTRRLQLDPELEDIGLIIFDEFHERSLHADLALMLSLEIQQSIREDLKLLVMSATIDTELIANYLGGPTVIECPGSCFPVSIEYHPVSSQGAALANLIAALISALNSVLTSSVKGDILVFLSGQAAISRSIQAAQELLTNDPQLQLIPLFGSLSLSQQSQALQADPQGNRRVIFATNIAETSLTIPNVGCVIDSGLEKVLIYEPNSALTALHDVRIAKASATQRAGRAGRTQAGHCIRLWSEQQQLSLADFQTEEILRADLIDLVLELSIWGHTDYQQIEWLTPPPKAHFESARQVLFNLNLVDQQGRATELGERAVKLGLPTRLATLLLATQDTAQCAMACELAALLADRDIFHTTNSASNSLGVDILSRMLALQDYKRDRSAAMRSYPIKRAAIEQLLTTSKRLQKQFKVASGQHFSLSQLQQDCPALLLLCYPERLAKRRDNQSGRYQMANGKGVFLYPDDPLFNAPWLVVADCDAQRKEGRIFNAALIDYSQIEHSLNSKFQRTESFKYNPNKQQIAARETLSYLALTLWEKPLTDIPRDKFQQCLKQVLVDCELAILPWSDACNHWLSRARWLSEHLDFPSLTLSTLVQGIDDWLMPYLSTIHSVKALKQLDLLQILRQCLTWEQQQLLEREAPTHYTTPSDKRLAITYDSNRSPVVAVALQEMFGELSSPTLAQGKVTITFELLSPAQRPIQTTSDLANFWHTSYFEVAKEMRGRYPKHRWPDQPLLEKPGRSIKTKKPVKK